MKLIIIVLVVYTDGRKKLEIDATRSSCLFTDRFEGKGEGKELKVGINKNVEG